MTGLTDSLSLASVSGSSGRWGFAQRQQEFSSLCLMISSTRRGERPVGERYFAFAVDDVFLQIERHGLRLADVFHGFGHGDARLFADVEETVYRRARCEDDGGVREYFDRWARNSFRETPTTRIEGLVGYLHVVFLGQFVERGFFDNCGPRLRNQYTLYFQRCE